MHKLRSLLVFAGAVAAVMSSLWGQGSLTPPPGAPAPSMKSLDQIYAAMSAPGGTEGERPLRYDITPRTTPLGPIPSLVIDEGAALFLKINGSVVEGENPHTSLGREHSIHVIAYGSSVAVAMSGGTSTGRRTYEPITFVKRIDKSTPLLLKALAQNQIVEGELRFYRASASDGSPEHYFTVEFKQGRISRLEQGLPGYDTFSVSFQTIRWTYVEGGVTFEDTISGSP